MGTTGSTYIQNMQVAVAKGRDGVAEQGDGQEGQEDLVCLGAPDANTRLLLEHVHAGDEKERGAELHGQSDGDVADDICPAADVSGEPADAGRGEHKRLVVHAARGRVDGRDLAERRGDAEDDQTDEQPAPNDDDRSATLQRIIQRGGQAVGDGGEHERHEGDMPSRAGAHKLSLVAHGGEHSVGIVRFAAALGEPYIWGAGSGILGVWTAHDRVRSGFRSGSCSCTQEKYWEDGFGVSRIGRLFLKKRTDILCMQKPRGENEITHFLSNYVLITGSGQEAGARMWATGIHWDAVVGSFSTQRSGRKIEAICDQSTC